MRTIKEVRAEKISYNLNNGLSKLREVHKNKNENAYIKSYVEKTMIKVFTDQNK
jgi:hypothetical protein